ncbi:MAG: glycosyltransferase [Ardenticatenaceae bacterium]|nr:glycosyltransferase [Ardenticatenaceae bacterium]
MKILFIVPYVPNLIRVRPFNLIRHLVLQGHQVTVATLWSTEGERRDLLELERSGLEIIAAHLPRSRSLINCVSTLLQKKPLQAAYCWQPALATQLESLFQPGKPDPFDVIHIEHLRGVPYALFLQQLGQRRSGRDALPLIWDSVDSISFLFSQAAEQSRSLTSRFITRFELPRTEQYERWLIQQFPKVLVTSPRDRRAFLDLLDPATQQQIKSRLTVLPNGVELAYFAPHEGIERHLSTLVVTGKMSYHANVTMVLHLVQQIMPLVWQERPDVQLEIVGKDPVRAIGALAENPRITVTGTVPDLRPHLQRATAAVAPVPYGAGIQNKVLEAMACGTPVVASSQAVSAIAAESPQQLLVADNPAEFAQAILYLLENPAQQDRLGAAGRHFVEEQHDWQNITGRLVDLYRDALQIKLGVNDVYSG